MASVSVCSPEDLLTWRFENGRVTADARAPAGPVPVGSLQKPFVAKAWAASHPGVVPPQLVCTGGSTCWFHPGHGRLGLARATALSCNAYFRALAEATPETRLAATLGAEGFAVPNPLTPGASIGLAEAGEATIAPERLLAAYLRLTREPWNEADTVRRELLAGLRDAALDGTAAGLGHRGFWAKTGTSPALDARPLTTSGWAVAVDDSGWAILGLLPYGTGSEAARALGAQIARLRPWSVVLATATQPAVAKGLRPSDREAPARVRVALFSLLHPRRVTARNVSGAPIGSSRGFVGPGGALLLAAGDRLDEGLWELAVPDRRLERRVRAALTCSGAPGGELRLVATMDAREYAFGVTAAEIPQGREPLRVALGAAALRFVAKGARHAAADVCDSTHCAFFVGRGPRVTWPGGERAILLARSVEASAAAPVSDLWPRILAAAREPGPSQWTSHCGGAPLSAWTVWGSGSRLTTSCPRHAAAAARPWSRRWSDADVEAAFGAETRRLAVTEREGVWTLRVESNNGNRDFLYDEAHRLLANVLDWGALPSPATRVVQDGDGYRAAGVGLGHRVGLCLGD